MARLPYYFTGTDSRKFRGLGAQGRARYGGSDRQDRAGLAQKRLADCDGEKTQYFASFTSAGGTARKIQEELISARRYFHARSIAEPWCACAKRPRSEL